MPNETPAKAKPPDPIELSRSTLLAENRALRDAVSTMTRTQLAMAGSIQAIAAHVLRPSRTTRVLRWVRSIPSRAWRALRRQAHGPAPR